MSRSDDTEPQACCRGSTATCPTTTLTRTSWRSSRRSSVKDEPTSAPARRGRCRGRLAVPESRRGRLRLSHTTATGCAAGLQLPKAARRRAYGVREAPPDARDDHRAGVTAVQITKCEGRRARPEARGRGRPRGRSRRRRARRSTGSARSWATCHPRRGPRGGRRGRARRAFGRGPRRREILKGGRRQVPQEGAPRPAKSGWVNETRSGAQGPCKYEAGAAAAARLGL